MRVHEIDDLVGIYEEDGSVKCRDCMKDEDWKELRKKDIITMGEIESSFVITVRRGFNTGKAMK